MTEHVVVFPISVGSDRWWMWCSVNIRDAMGIDRVRWSRPYGPIVAPADEPEIGPRTSNTTGAPLFSYDAPIVIDK